MSGGSLFAEFLVFLGIDKPEQKRTSNETTAKHWVVGGVVLSMVSGGGFASGLGRGAGSPGGSSATMGRERLLLRALFSSSTLATVRYSLCENCQQLFYTLLTISETRSFSQCISGLASTSQA